MLMIKRVVRKDQMLHSGWDGEHYVECSKPIGTGYTVDGIVDDIIRYATYPVCAYRPGPKGTEYLVGFPPMQDAPSPVPMFRNREDLCSRVTLMLNAV